MTLPAPGIVRTIRYVRVGADLADPGRVLRPYLDDGYETDGRVVLPASGRTELATVLVWKDEPEVQG